MSGFPWVHIWSWKSRWWPGVWVDGTVATYLSRQGDYVVLIEKPRRPQEARP